MKEFISNILGDGSIPNTIAALFYAYLGAFVSLLMQATNRDPGSKRTPFCFKWEFLFSDNAKRIIANIILIFLAIRFSKEWFGTTVTMWTAAGIGFGFDKLAEMVKNFTKKPEPTIK